MRIGRSQGIAWVKAHVAGTAFLSLPIVAVVVFLVFDWRATRSADIVTAMDLVSIWRPCPRVTSDM
ncbi:UNVERIFIED_CONTAM: hypothetical protein RKD43_006255 [Streptomyces graminofaciens]